MSPQGLDWRLYLIVLFYLLVVAVIDIEHRIILRSLTIVGILLSLLAGYLMHGLPITLLGFVSGTGLMGLIYLAGILFSKWMEKKKGEPVEDALGSGDIYVSAIAGLLTAFPGVFSAILMAIVMGGFVSLAFVVYMLIRREYRAFTPIPYAPFIILATVIAMYRM
jgi:prepilin signal peptidase PulO-like enzyme (type II secretory pathway)